MGKSRYYRRGRYRLNVDPDRAHERAIKAAQSRTGNDYHIRKLTEAAATLTGEQRQQLAALAGEHAA
jgi:hypothetical protein